MKRKSADIKSNELLKDLEQGKYPITTEQFLEMFRAWNCMDDMEYSFYMEGKTKYLEKLLKCFYQFVDVAKNLKNIKRDKRLEDSVSEALDKLYYQYVSGPNALPEYSPSRAADITNSVDVLRITFHTYITQRTIRDKDLWYKLQNYMKEPKKTEETMPKKEKKTEMSLMRRDPFLEELWRRTVRQTTEQPNHRITAGDVVPFRLRRKTSPTSKPVTVNDVKEQEKDVDSRTDEFMEHFHALVYSYDNLVIDLQKIGEMLVTLLPHLPRQETVKAGKLISKIRSILRLIKSKDA